MIVSICVAGLLVLAFIEFNRQLELIRQADYRRLRSKLDAIRMRTRTEG